MHKCYNQSEVRMMSSRNESERAFRYCPYPEEGKNRNYNALAEAEQRQKVIYAEILHRADADVILLVNELCFALGQERELAEQHYFTEGWRAAKRHRARKRKQGI